MTTEIPNPLDLLREHHRNALDRQAELTTEARALAARARQVAAEMPVVTARVNTYGALISALTRPHTEDKGAKQ